MKLFDDREDIGLADEEVLLIALAHLDLIVPTGVEYDLRPDLDRDRDKLAVIVDPARAAGDDYAELGLFFLCCIGDGNSCRRLLVRRVFALDEHAVAERLDTSCFSFCTLCHTKYALTW